MKINATQLLEKIVDMGGSDLHVSVGNKPHIRVNTVLSPIAEYPDMGVDDVEYFLSQILDTKQRELLDINKEIDFSISLGAKAKLVEKLLLPNCTNCLLKASSNP